MTMNQYVNYRPYQTIDLDAVYQLLIGHGWQHRIIDIQFLEKLITSSQLVYVAEYRGQIIGFARAITDFLSNAYLSMMVIESRFQRRGIGGQLLQAIMAQAPSVTWVLRAGRGQGESKFFQSQGFILSNQAMEKPRTRIS